MKFEITKLNVILKQIIQIKFQKMNVFHEIFNHKIFIKYQYKIYITPLFLAVENKNLEIINLLLTNNKIDIDIPYILTKM